MNRQVKTYIQNMMQKDLINFRPLSKVMDLILALVVKSFIK